MRGSGTAEKRHEDPGMAMFGCGSRNLQGGDELDTILGRIRIMSILMNRRSLLTRYRGTAFISGIYSVCTPIALSTLPRTIIRVLSILLVQDSHPRTRAGRMEEE